MMVCSNFRFERRRASRVSCFVFGAQRQEFPVRGQPLRNTQYAIRNTFYTPRSALHAFTLIEIMVVVGLMGLILTISVRILYKIWHRAPISQATADLFEVLSNARARAILQGKQVDVVFHPREGSFEIEGAGSQAAGRGQVNLSFIRGSGGGTHGTLSER